MQSYWALRDRIPTRFVLISQFLVSWLEEMSNTGFGTVAAFRNSFGLYPNSPNPTNASGGGGGAVVTDTTVELFYPGNVPAGELSIHRIELAGRVFCQLFFDIFSLPGQTLEGGVLMSWNPTPALVGLGQPVDACITFCSVSTGYGFYTYRVNFEIDGSGSGLLGNIAGADTPNDNARQTFQLIW